jgi:hypothetical protein
MFDSLCTMFCNLRFICFVPFFSLPQPYKTQQRLAVVFSTLCAALAFNAACFGPATELFSGDFSVSFGASLCMIIINQIFSQLYVLSAQWAAEKHSTWSTWTVVTHASVASVISGSIFLCLVYSVQFDAAVTARWFAVVLMSFAQSFLFTGPLWILFKLVVYVLLARFRMRGMTPNEQRRALAVGEKGVIMVDEDMVDATNTFAGPKHLPAVIEMSAVVVGATEAPESHHHVNADLPASVASTQKSKKTHGGFVAFHDDDDSSHGSGGQHHTSHLPASIISVAASAFANPLFAGNQSHHQQFDDDEEANGNDENHAIPVISDSIASKRQSYHQQFDLVSIPTSSIATPALARRQVDDDDGISHSAQSLGDRQIEPARRVVVLNPNALFDPTLSRVDAVTALAGEVEAQTAAPSGLESVTRIDERAEVVSSGSIASAMHPRPGAQRLPLPMLSANALFDAAAASGLIDDYATESAQNSSAAHLTLSSNALYDFALEEHISGTLPVSGNSSTDPM